MFTTEPQRSQRIISLVRNNIKATDFADFRRFLKQKLDDIFLKMEHGIAPDKNE